MISSFYNFLRIKFCYRTYWKQWVVFLISLFSLIFLISCNEEDNIIDKYNYEEDILTDVQVRHNVINSDEWRLTFFANFEEPVDVIKVQL